MVTLSQLQANVQEKLNKDLNRDNYDVIVIGVGSMGSSACYHLAKQGLKVLGIEQFDVPHEQGAHAGQSRIIRQAYFEHPSYVPLLKSAYEGWSQLEQESSTQLFFKTGLLYFGPQDHFLIKGSLESAQHYGISVKQMSRDQQVSQYPQFEIPARYTRMMEVEAGLLTPERAVLTFIDQALHHGAQIHTREQFLQWKKENGAIQVKTNKQIYHCKKLVLASGAWTSKMTDLKDLEVTRQVIAWAKPNNRDLFQLDNFPTWTYADPSVPGIYYGFPELPTETFGGSAGLKVAHHTKGRKIDPDSVDRVVSKDEEIQLLEAIRDFIPGLESIITSKTCLYTNSVDDDFIIDFHPENQDVVVAAGFSGHGFKFASIVGEILTDLVIDGKTTHPIDFLSLQRRRHNSQFLAKSPQFDEE